jgi:transcriptional regulator with XRE-family HTH domain
MPADRSGKEIGMKLDAVLVVARDLQRARHHTRDMEIALQAAVAQALSEEHGSGRELSRRLGISAAYLCDIRHGRRKVSDAFLERLLAEYGPKRKTA